MITTLLTVGTEQFSYGSFMFGFLSGWMALFFIAVMARGDK